MNEAKYINSQEVAKMVGITLSTLGSWRRRKKHLKYKKVGGRISYKLEDVQKFLANAEIDIENDI